MKISVAIIVKDEEEIIKRCLSSVSLFADEIVVVDTGSTDKTKELAVNFPKVSLFDSEHFDRNTHYSEFSFSVAKNEAIKKCTGDIVCWWDADDVIDEIGAKKIRDLAENDNGNTMYDFHISYGNSLFYHCRMFPNGKGILFDEKHSCHEYLLTMGLPRRSCPEVVINHRPVHKSVGSNKRNLAILEKDYYERGFKDQRTIFYLANAYREGNDFKHAVSFYDKYLEISEWAEERLFARYYKAQCLNLLGDWEESRDELLRTIMEDDRYAEPYCLLGDIYAKKERKEEAVSWFMMAQNCEIPSNSVLFVQPNLYSTYPANRIKELGSVRMPAVVTSPSVVIQNPKSENKIFFKVPEDKRLAIMSAAIMSKYSKKDRIVAVVPDMWIASMFRVVNGIDEIVEHTEEKVLEFEVPEKLLGIHAFEWLSKSVNFQYEDILFPSFNMDFQLVSKAMSQENKVIVQTGHILSDDLLQGIADLGFEVLLLDDCKMGMMDIERKWFSVILAEMINAKFFVGVSGWGQYIAGALGKSAIILGDVKGYELEGQNNLQGMRDKEVLSFIEKNFVDLGEVLNV